MPQRALTEKERAILDSALQAYVALCLENAVKASKLERMNNAWAETGRQAEELYRFLGEADKIEVSND